MPDYRLVYLLVYRVVALSDNDAAARVRDDLSATFPDAKFDVLDVTQSAVQVTPGATTFDVRLRASGVVTRATITLSLTAVTPPASLSPSGATLQSSVQGASVDTRVLDHLRSA